MFRRDDRIRRLVTTLLGRASRPELPVLAPEIQLLHKSRSLRDKDAADFISALPHLAVEERDWLREALCVTSPDHEWIGRSDPIARVAATDHGRGGSAESHGAATAGGTIEESAGKP